MERGIVSAVDELDVLDRQFLLERHLLSPDLTAEAKHRGIAIAADESLSVMINEEDHLRLQCMKSGIQLDEAWERSVGSTTRSERSSPSRSRTSSGYLTACPTNVGTGMRASVLVHLPSLVLTQRVKKVLAGVTQVGLAVRGFHGEGSDVVGNFFQISNQVTLGVSEAATLEKLQRRRPPDPRDGGRGPASRSSGTRGSRSRTRSAGPTGPCATPACSHRRSASGSSPRYASG